MANKFLSDVNLTAALEANGQPGTSGQILSSTGTGVQWIDETISLESNLVYFDVKNSTGSTISKGKGIMAVGTDGNSGHILIDEMIGDGSIEPKYFLGVLEDDLDNGETGRVISFGIISQFNTTGQNGETWADGNILWCDPINAGDFTITEPDGPNLKIAAAIILNSYTNGKIQVRVQDNEGRHDLHDTKITSQADGDVLVWNDTDGVWLNDKTLSVDYTAGRVGIGTTGPNEKLHVGGNILVDSAILSNQENTDVDTGTETVAEISSTTYTAAFFDYVIKNGSNVRSGTVYACHDGSSNVEYTETSTNDLGDTSDVTLLVDISGGNIRLRATTTSDNWSIKSLVRGI